jgi:uncharacterized membrane protein YdfJ with MMPL/SSD domain
VRFIISHDGDPMTPEGISHIDAIKKVAKEALKGTLIITRSVVASAVIVGTVVVRWVRLSGFRC